MVRQPVASCRGYGGFPHPRGDGPVEEMLACYESPFTPPAWGWPDAIVSDHPIPRVFPTRVGMVRPTARRAKGRRSFPHPRGDGPPGRYDKPEPFWFSPPAWGWSARVTLRLFLRLVFPTRVGMVRYGCPAGCRPSRFPHPRGDGPNFPRAGTVPRTFSPPAWGWSVLAVLLIHELPVFPTRVGMVRERSSLSSAKPGFPHPRGDGPECLRSGPRVQIPPQQFLLPRRAALAFRLMAELKVGFMHVSL